MAYKGKYPHRIKSVGSVKSERAMVAVTNAGFRYKVFPRTALGSAHIPAVGRDISDYIQSPDYFVGALDGDVSNARG